MQQIDWQTILMLLGGVLVLAFVFFVWKNLIKLFFTALIVLVIYFAWQFWQQKGSEDIQQIRQKGSDVWQRGKDVVSRGKEAVARGQEIVEQGKELGQKMDSFLPTGESSNPSQGNPEAKEITTTPADSSNTP